MHKPSITISIIIPTYLGVGITTRLTERLTQVLSQLTGNYEILLVNDASPDNSWTEIEELCRKNNKIKGINLAWNAGQHAAITAGLLLSHGEYIVVMDCDLQDQPEELPKLWAKIQDGYEIVMARRTQRKDTVKGQFISWCFHQCLSWRRGIRANSAIANYGIYSRKVLEKYIQENRQYTKPFSIVDYVKCFRLATVDVIHGKSARGKSSYSYKKLISLALFLLFPEKQKIKQPLFDIRHTINLTINKYGVTLRPLAENDLEMVRNWRNSTQISSFMEYREYITPEMQKQWYESIYNEWNHYFIITYEENEIGLAHCRIIDQTERVGEGGIFIFDSRYLGSDISFRVSMAMIDYGVEVLQIKRGVARILRTNKRAIKYNQMLGYVLLPGQENVENQLYQLNYETYSKNRKSILEII